MNNTGKWKPWLYLLPSLIFLGIFMVYPLFDVIIYSLEEGYNSAAQTYWGVGLYNFRYVLRDPYFLQALQNTFLIVIITVPVSTGLALLISLGLNSISRFKDLFQTIFFSAICHEYAGSRPCLHDSFQKKLRIRRALSIF